MRLVGEPPPGFLPLFSQLKTESTVAEWEAVNFITRLQTLTAGFSGLLRRVQCPLRPLGEPWFLSVVVLASGQASSWSDHLLPKIRLWSSRGQSGSDLSFKFLLIFIFGCAGSSLPCVFFPSCGKQGWLSGCGALVLPAVASLAAQRGSRARGLQWLWHEGSAVAAHGLESTGSIILAHGLSYYMSSGIFPDQGSNPRLLHWQADSLPLSHQGSLSFDHFLLDFQWTACSHSFVSLLVLCI